MILSITKVGIPLKLTRNVNKANGHKLGRKTHTKVFAKNVGPYTAGERKILPNELSDKIATFFIAHLFKYLFREWY